MYRDIMTYAVYIVKHDDVIKWKHFPCYWRFVRDSPHKGQWCRVLMFSFDQCLNKRLRKQMRCRWFEMPSCSLWHHSNVIHFFFFLLWFYQQFLVDSNDVVKYFPQRYCTGSNASDVTLKNLGKTDPYQNITKQMKAWNIHKQIIDYNYK